MYIGVSAIDFGHAVSVFGHYWAKLAIDNYMLLNRLCIAAFPTILHPKFVATCHMICVMCLPALKLKTLQ